MPPSEVVGRLLFDWEQLSPEEVEALAKDLPRKIVRWLGYQHPDNRTRKIFLRMTGVPIGEGTVINPYLCLHDGYEGLVSFGRRVSVADHVTFVADSGPNNAEIQHLPFVAQHLVRRAPVRVDDDAWIGTHAVVLPGVTIGRGAVVGAGAVVTRDVPPFTVVAGVPARIVRRLDPATPDHEDSLPHTESTGST